MSAEQGEALARISNGIVGIFSENYGRGPTRAKTYLFDDYVLTVLEDILTPVEHTLVETGRSDMVRQVRLTFQEAVSNRFIDVVEEHLGRKVRTYHSQVVFDPALAFEIFVLEPQPGSAS